MKLRRYFEGPSVNRANRLLLKAGVFLLALSVCSGQSSGSLREIYAVPIELEVPKISLPTEAMSDKVETRTNKYGVKINTYYKNDKILIIKEVTKDNKLWALHHYDDSGKVIASGNDTNSDGKLDIVRLNYENSRLMDVKDRDYDGTFDTWQIRGRDQRVEAYVEDKDNNGNVDKRKIWNGRVCVKMEEDRDLDGRIDFVVLRHKNGNTIYEREEYCARRQGIEVTENFYDPNRPGRLLQLKMIERNPKTGLPKECLEEKYDPNSTNRVIYRKKDVDTNGDGRPDIHIKMNEDGVEGLDEDSNGDGILDIKDRSGQSKIGEGSSGPQALYQIIEKDRNGDGKIDYWAWCVNKILWLELKDDDYNGLPEIIEEPLK